MLMPVSFSGFQGVSLKSVLLAIMNCVLPIWAPLEAFAADLRARGLQDSLGKGPKGKEHKDAETTVNDCHVTGGTCAGHAGDLSWELLSIASGRDRLGESGWGQLGQPHGRKYHFRTCWESGMAVEVEMGWLEETHEKTRADKWKAL